MVDEIKALIDTKFEELSKKIDTLQYKIDANHNALQKKQIRKLRNPLAKALKIKRSWNT